MKVGLAPSTVTVVWGTARRLHRYAALHFPTTQVEREVVVPIGADSVPTVHVSAMLQTEAPDEGKLRIITNAKAEVARCH